MTFPRERHSQFFLGLRSFKTMEVGFPNGLVFCVALVTLLFMDACWFTIALRLKVYPSFEGVRLYYALLAWTALAFAISTLRAADHWDAVRWGLSVGSVTYAVFNGTELAIRPDWTVRTALVDLLWGMTCVTTSCVFAHMV